MRRCFALLIALHSPSSFSLPSTSYSIWSWRATDSLVRSSPSASSLSAPPQLHIRYRVDKQPICSFILSHSAASLPCLHLHTVYQVEPAEWLTHCSALSQFFLLPFLHSHSRYEVDKQPIRLFDPRPQLVVLCLSFVLSRLHSSFFLLSFFLSLHFIFHIRSSLCSSLFVALHAAISFARSSSSYSIWSCRATDWLVHGSACS